MSKPAQDLIICWGTFCIVHVTTYTLHLNCLVAYTFALWSRVLLHLRRGSSRARAPELRCGPNLFFFFLIFKIFYSVTIVCIFSLIFIVRVLPMLTFCKCRGVKLCQLLFALTFVFKWIIIADNNSFGPMIA